MKLLDIVQRPVHPEPWLEGDNIPWHEPGFSARMLREHFSQEHDAASRRAKKIERHVDWIHEALLSQEPTCILDLGCGPGLYTSRLATLGHHCTGIDYSPASLRYARQQASEQGLRCSYLEHDVRHAHYGGGYGLVMMLYGEFNVFKPDDARVILAKVCDGLNDGGILLIEPHTFEAVRRMGEEAPTWYSSASGLFMNEPHLCLMEHNWHAERRVATTRYFILTAASGEATRYTQSMQAYTQAEYRTLLREAGFGEITFYPSLTGSKADTEPGLCAITGKKTRGRAP